MTPLSASTISPTQHCRGWRLSFAAPITDAKDLTPESRGLDAIAEGVRLVYRDDQELLEREFPVYDALYAWCRHFAEEA